MTMLTKLLLEKDVAVLSHDELIERLVMVRHLPEFEIYFEKFSPRFTSDDIARLRPPPSALFYQVRNYSFYLLMQSAGDPRTQYRTALNYISVQRQNESLVEEELQLLRYVFAFFLRYSEISFLMLWTIAVEIFLYEPYNPESSDYQELLIKLQPSNADPVVVAQLQAWEEVDLDMLIHIITTLRKSHKTLGKSKLTRIHAYIEEICQHREKV